MEYIYTGATCLHAMSDDTMTEVIGGERRDGHLVVLASREGDCFSRYS